MARKLLIKKYSEGIFGHKDFEIALEFFVSKFFIDIDQNYFQIKEGNGGSGARRFQYLFTDVSIQVGNGVIETYSSKQALLARLIEIRYTGMMDYVPPGGAVTSITVNDENYTPDGNGLVNLGTIGGGGSIATTQTFTATEGNPKTFTLTGGKIAIQVHSARGYVPKSAWSQTGSNVDVVWDFFDGDDVDILVQ